MLYQITPFFTKTGISVVKRESSIVHSVRRLSIRFPIYKLFIENFHLIIFKQPNVENCELLYNQYEAAISKLLHIMKSSSKRIKVYPV